MCTPATPQITSKEQAVTAFRLFQEKFELIRSYSFFQNLTPTTKHTWSHGKSTYVYDGPSDEQIDAVLLHLRFFMIGNEDCSLQWFTQCLQQINAPTKAENAVNRAFSKFEKWKNSPSRVSGLTKQRLFMALLYGNRVHANDTDRVTVCNELMESFVVGPIELLLVCELITEYCDFMFRFYSIIKKHKLNES